MRYVVVAVAVLLVTSSRFAAARETAGATAVVRYQTVHVDGVDIFYREAGPKDAPVVLLLHGFPSSSFMFRDLLPRLATHYRVLAPDYPGFGQSSLPPRRQFQYTFDHLARVMSSFVRHLGLQRYVLYIQDYGAPIGLRLALLEPERVTGLIVQNGNAYEDGFNAGSWAPLRAYWHRPTPARRQRLRGWLTSGGVRQQYVGGVPQDQLARFSPDTWTLDWALLSRRESLEVQLDLFGDYATNVALYPRFHEFFRERRPPALILWGKHDPFFTPAGAEAYRRDLPDAELIWLDAGHFALETHAAEIGEHILRFLSGKSPAGATR